MARLSNLSILGVVTSPLSTDNITSAVSVPEGCVLKQEADVVPWNNEDNLIPKQAEVIVRILLTGISLPVCFLVSLSSNTISMTVFWKQGLGERINMLLFTLSLMDLLYVATSYVFNSDVLYMVLVGRGNEVRAIQAYMFNYFVIGLIGTGSASHVLSSIIALERCLCITRPLLAKNLMSTPKTAVVLWIFLLVLIAGVFVACMRYTVECVFDASDNSTALQFFLSELYFQNQEFFFIGDGIIYGILLPAFCMCCVFVCTLIIVVKMRALSSWRDAVSSASDSLASRDMAVTRMIVGTSVLFIVCLVPSMVVRILLFVTPDLRLGGRYENLYSVLLWVFYALSVINSSFNFFVYYVYGTKFRQTVHQLFCSRGCCKTTQNKA